MKHLKRLTLLFFFTLVIPLGFLVAHTIKSLEQEETAELHFFANALFDTMEANLEAMVKTEEERPISDFSDTTLSSPLSKTPIPGYVLGYYQYNPDGTVKTFTGDQDKDIKPVQQKVVEKLPAAVSLYSRKTSPAKKSEPSLLKEKEALKRKAAKPQFAGKYLDSSPAYSRSKGPRQESLRVEQLDREQSVLYSLNESVTPLPEPFKAEIYPIQSIAIDSNELFLFRQVIINNRMYRQGLVIYMDQFLNHLITTFFSTQPMARFTTLTLSASLQTLHQEQKSGIDSGTWDIRIERQLQRPFSFITATIACEKIPPSTSRTSLMIMITMIAVVFFLGMIILFKSASVIEEHAQRRAGFVSSVTHELKTPLTTIRMYIEMLEQGMARDIEHEQRYFKVIASESARLSRLISNVLEFSKLENRTRQLTLQPGNLKETIDEVIRILDEQINSQGFTVHLDLAQLKPFSYDREAMIQILINLIENALKFGKDSETRQITILAKPESGMLNLSVTDSGPGIPRHALNKVFDDFYRVDSSLTRTTKGTGIGLALVRKLVQAMGGRVTAFNNSKQGCTIQCLLPY